jgi:short-subunit dehydrogenase
MQSLEHKVVVLTGAAGGIGSHVAADLRRAGARVIGVDRVENDRCKEMIIADLSTEFGLKELSNRLEDISCDVLINLAGVQYFGPLADQPPATLWRDYVVNLIAPAMLVRAVLPGMLDRGEGRIVNIGSVFGAIPFAYFASYSSGKAGLKALSEALRRELADTGVEVTHIAPRAVKTALATEKVTQFAAATKMHMDDPADVARRIVTAVAKGERDVVIGFPESLFVRINALVPRLVDRALAAGDRKAAALFR